MASQPACDLVRAKYMQIAVNHAAKASAAGFGGIAAVLVDPVADQVLAVASRTDRHPLRHPVMQCIGKFSNVLNGNIQQNDQELAPHSAASPAGAPPVKRRKLDAQEQYLCSGFDMYTTVEPCTM